MSRARTHRATEILAGRLARAATTIPSILDHLDEQRGNITTLSAPTGGGGSKGDHSDPVLRTVMALDGVNIHRRAIADQVYCVNVAINLLEQACADALGYRAGRRKGERPEGAAVAEPLCGGGDPSTWGDPTCGELVESALRQYGIWYHPSGLCVNHRRRRERYERAGAAA